VVGLGLFATVCGGLWANLRKIALPLAEISWPDRLLVAGAVFRRLQEGSADWMAPKSVANRAGLDAKLTQQRDGQWQIRLIDDSGTEVFTGVYGSDQSARAGARQWVLKNYNVETEEVSKPKKPSKPRSLGPAPGHLGEMMRARADDNEEKAIGLRAEADYLEMEAKRLRAAADTLEGSDGQT